MFIVALANTKNPPISCNAKSTDNFSSLIYFFTTPLG